MKRRAVFGAALLLCIGVACGAGAQVSYTLLHDFAGGPGDGSSPAGDLLLKDDAFFGMTAEGGAANGGVIFSVGRDGSGFTLLHSFAGGPGDGAQPAGSLITVGDTLYGMTSSGGATGQGVVFSIAPDGTGFTVLHEFTGDPGDGAVPQGNLFHDGSRLYGMTAAGGAALDGVIFSMNTDGSGYSILHDFAGDPGDGSVPFGTLIADDGALYGMTAGGGYFSYGTVFSVKKDGSDFTLLHDFAFVGAIPYDGAFPLGSLVSDGSTLYGMTMYGGAGGFYIYGGGTVFAMEKDGSGYTHLHDFTFSPGDGMMPAGSLISDNGTLYGMTQYGGSMAIFPFIQGFGTVFSIGSDGADFTLLHTFSPPLDGYSPTGSLVSDDSTLYGMTPYGGTYDSGVIFACTLPPVPPNYVELTAQPEEVAPGGPVTLSWKCDFSRWAYEGVPVDVFLAVIEDPVVTDGPSSVGEALSGGIVWLFGPGMRSVYVYDGTLLVPAWTLLEFPPAPVEGSITLNVPPLPGNYVFAALFRFSSTNVFVRTDGKPVENSNIFSIQ